MKVNTTSEFQGREFNIDIHYSDIQPSLGSILFCHGFKGFKDWGAFDLIAEYFSENGYDFVKFNYAWGGTTIDNPNEISDVEAFGENNFTKELDQTLEMIDWICRDEKLNINNIILMGHSRGGGIATLAANNPRVSSLITLAAVTDIEEYIEKNILPHIKEDGNVYVENKRTKQILTLYPQIYEDLKKNIDRLSIPINAQKLDIPALIIHGTEDEALSVEYAVNLHNWIPNSELLIMEGSGHTFGASHPWEENSLPVDLKIVVEEILDFLSTESPS